MSRLDLEDRAIGCLVGSAVGDALGVATEEHTQAEIRERYNGWVEGIVPPFHEDWKAARPHAPYHNGDGIISDDTIMTHILVEAYLAKGTHLNAFDVDTYVVPALRSPRWIPHLEALDLPERAMWLPEKYMSLRLMFGNVDPRQAGVGNTVNCGAAMYMAPVGVVNAANPRRAYAEAIDVASAHQSSFGQEAAGVYAAAVAEAMRPGATPDSVVEVAITLANDGTREAVISVAEAVADCTDWRMAGPVLRRAIAPYDTMGEDYLVYGRESRLPSRAKSIEEVPVALGFFLLAHGDYKDTVLGAVNYGRDADSIASMGGALAGAFGGQAAVPQEWQRDVAAASRTNIVQPGQHLAALAREIFLADQAYAELHTEAFVKLTTVDN